MTDPYKYFRIEGRELVEGLTQGVLDLEKGSSEPELVSRLLRYAHTLKGAARIVQQAKIAELSHSMEEVLARARNGKERISPADIRQLLTWIDQISAELGRLGPPAPVQAPASPAPEASAQRGPAVEAGDEHLESIRIDIKDMDALLRTVSELRVQMTGLSRLAQELQAAAQSAEEGREDAPSRARNRLEDTLLTLHRSTSGVLERAGRELQGLYEQAEAMRLVPANSIFGVLERAARDAAEATGKQIAFEVSGGEARLDARGLKLLRNALIHLVRNAVTHGVERPEERTRNGKPPAGQVRIRVEHFGDRAVFRCLDDGRGVDLERVRQVMLDRKLMTAAEAAELTPAAAMSQLLRGGITTTRSVSQLSGRGVGLEVARETAAVLNGSITGETEPGRGTRIDVSVPVVVESQDVLHVRAADIVMSVPLRAVRLAARLSPEDIAVSSEGHSVLYEGRAVRYAPLVWLLKNQTAQLPRIMTVLILESPSGVAALGVDRVVGRERVVIRALPRILGNLPTLSGAFLDGEGNPQQVLNPEGVVKAISSVVRLEDASPASRTPRLLVIDDSLTSRMLEQGILETAGYQVETAGSGEEAIEKAAQTPYDLFVVDLEMPGMDGFQFIQAVRARPQLSAIPAIVVTSRGAAEDRARGVAVGANAYIVKGEFNEGLFLKTVHELVS